MQTIQQEFVLHAFNCERTFLTPFRNCIFHYRGIKAILKNREYRKSSVFFFFFFFFFFGGGGEGEQSDLFQGTGTPPWEGLGSENDILWKQGNHTRREYTRLY